MTTVESKLSESSNFREFVCLGMQMDEVLALLGEPRAERSVDETTIPQADDAFTKRAMKEILVAAEFAYPTQVISFNWLKRVVRVRAIIAGGLPGVGFTRDVAYRSNQGPMPEDTSRTSLIKLGMSYSEVVDALGGPHNVFRGLQPDLPNGASRAERDARARTIECTVSYFDFAVHFSSGAGVACIEAIIYGGLTENSGWIPSFLAQVNVED